jgi:cardiolipin synthase A/B
MENVFVALLAVLVVALGIVIWSIRRHRDPRLDVDCEAPIGELLASLTGLTQGAVYEGNALELFENGAFFDAQLAEIRGAQHTVHFETFLWKEGELGRRLVDALVERRAAGVKVRVMLDAKGCSGMGDDAKRALEGAGVRLRFHHPTHLRHIGVINDRDHRKLCIVDGRAALLGGHCIVDAWLGNAEDKDHVHDLGVRLRGPAVHGLQGTFAENWIEDTGELFVGDEAFPPLQREGDARVHVASVKPEGSPPAVKILHQLAICVARRRIRIQNPYFLPGPQAIDALVAAVRRGVDVRVMVPSVEASDMPLVQHAAHRNFQKLLDGGVRLFEYPRCLLHQKVMTIDGVWSAVGSSNFDARSFETNDEVTIGVLDEALAQSLEAVFERDAALCVERSVAEWKRRGPWHRLRDNAFYAFRQLL